MKDSKKPFQLIHEFPYTIVPYALQSNKNHKLTTKEHLLMLLVCLRTLSFRKDSDVIPYTQIIEFCGCSRNSVNEIITSLVDKGLISVYKSSHKMTRFYFTENHFYTLIKFYGEEKKEQKPVIEDTIKPTRKVGRPRKEKVIKEKIKVVDELEELTISLEAELPVEKPVIEYSDIEYNNTIEDEVDCMEIDSFSCVKNIEDETNYIEKFNQCVILDKSELECYGDDVDVDLSDMKNIMEIINREKKENLERIKQQNLIAKFTPVVKERELEEICLEF